MTRMTSCWTTLAVLTLATTSQACRMKGSSSGLTAQAAVAQTPPAEVNLPCMPDALTIHAPQPLEIRSSNTPNRLNANWCFKSKASGQARMLFIVDTSGSMKNSDPGCMRYEAVRREIERLRSSGQNQGEVQVGAVVFSSIAQPVTTGFISANNALNDPQFRDYICTSAGETNYGTGFQAAQEMVRNAPAIPNSPIYAYFLTDGMPTDLPPNQPAGGVSAALRQEINQRDEGSALFAIYLDAMGGGPSAFGGAAAAGAIAGGYGMPVAIGPSTLGGLMRDPKQTLADITGSEQRVVTTADANQLPAMMATLNKPAVPIDVKTVAFTKNIGGRSEKSPCRGDGECKVVFPDPANNTSWQVSLEFFADPGKMTPADNILITGKRVDGSDISAILDLRGAAIR